jgi:hypothetical protein
MNRDSGIHALRKTFTFGSLIPNYDLLSDSVSNIH